ncbi:unnamed protein product [Soboliphyme baturini]|uniref:Secreted protein n=1 Tax=Soboliphyme baturini TaxID=241478 RepID=A0A183J2W3_9BILA|nr:unnamed protein product [Soboliphyme baturini]
MERPRTLLLACVLLLAGESLGVDDSRWLDAEDFVRPLYPRRNLALTNTLASVMHDIIHQSGPFTAFTLPPFFEIPDLLEMVQQQLEITENVPVSEDCFADVLFFVREVVKFTTAIRTTISNECDEEMNLEMKRVCELSVAAALNSTSWVAAGKPRLPIDSEQTSKANVKHTC